MIKKQVMKKLVAIASLLLLSACGSNAPLYDTQNFKPNAWASVPFEKAKADCSYETLNHNQIWDTYELETPRYKACMEKNGYSYVGGTDWAGNPVPAQAQQK